MRSGLLVLLGLAAFTPAQAQSSDMVTPATYGEIAAARSGAGAGNASERGDARDAPVRAMGCVQERVEAGVTVVRVTLVERCSKVQRTRALWRDGFDVARPCSASASPACSIELIDDDDAVETAPKVRRAGRSAL